MIMKTLTAEIKKEEKGYTARCPEVGTVAAGETETIALKKLKEITENYLRQSYPELFTLQCRSDMPLLKWKV